MSTLIKNEGARNITWRLERDQPITEEEAREAQSRAGFMPMGYGFWGFRTFTAPAAPYSYFAEWQCSRSCD